MDHSKGSYSPDKVATLLSFARRLIDEGNTSLALQAVVTALRDVGGEQAILPTLTRAREHYQRQLKSNAAADELSALFAECAIAEASLTMMNGTHSADGSVPSSSGALEAEQMDIGEGNLLNQKAPILAESGRMQVVMDASSDGSSFICLQCGGVVSNLRKDEHNAFWCAQSPL